jgi:hypothetical protein
MSGSQIDKQLLIEVGGNPRDLRCAGWYGIVIIDDTDGSYFRAYVGQAMNLGQRLQQHTEASRESPDTTRHKSLLYHVWRKPNRRALFLQLGELRGYQKGSEADELTLNIGEQLLAEAFQTLQVRTMERILPDVELKSAHGLNIALPVHQATKSGSKESNDTAIYNTMGEFAFIHNSTDPEVLQYYNENHHKFTTEQQEKGRKSMVEDNHKQQIHGARQSRQNKTSSLQRGPLYEGEEEVEVFCMKCKSESSRHVDPAPTYEISTDQYVARRASCSVCPGISATKKAREVMVPYDRAMPFVRWNWVGKNINRNDPRWAHKR